MIALQQAQDAWKEVTEATIKNCLEKSGVIKGNDDLMKVQKDNLEFEVLSRELSPDIQIPEPMINENEVD